MACEYCSDQSKPIIVNESVRIDVDEFRKDIYITYHDQMWDCEVATINFCPMCGRDLRGDDQ